jgi:hypothetical protein
MQPAQTRELESDTPHESVSGSELYDRTSVPVAVSEDAAVNQRLSSSPGNGSILKRKRARALRTAHTRPSKTTARISHVTKNMNSCLLCSTQKQACDRGFYEKDGPNDGHSKVLPCSREYHRRTVFGTSRTDQLRHQDASG